MKYMILVTMIITIMMTDSEEIENNLFQSDLKHIPFKVFAKEKCNQKIESVGIKMPEMMKSTLTCAGTDVRFLYQL